MKMKNILFGIVIPAVLALLSFEYIYLRIFSADVFSNLALRLEMGQRPAHIFSYLYGHFAVLALIVYLLVLAAFIVHKNRVAK